MDDSHSTAQIEKLNKQKKEVKLGRPRARSSETQLVDSGNLPTPVRSPSALNRSSIISDKFNPNQTNSKLIFNDIN